MAQKASQWGDHSGARSTDHRAYLPPCPNPPSSLKGQLNVMKMFQEALSDPLTYFTSEHQQLPIWTPLLSLVTLPSTTVIHSYFSYQTVSSLKMETNIYKAPSPHKTLHLVFSQALSRFNPYNTTQNVSHFPTFGGKVTGLKCLCICSQSDFY